MGFQLGGLISGLDTRSLIDQLMSVERQPINNLLLKKSKINTQVETYQKLNTKLSVVQQKALDLTRVGNVIGRLANSSNTSKVDATVTSNAAVGSFTINVSQLASATTLTTNNTGGNGVGGIGTEFTLADATNPALTIDQINTDNRLNQDVSLGKITVNGQEIDVTGSKTLGDLLGEIQTKLGAAAYNVTNNKVTFEDVAGTPTFGNPGDTSNLLDVLGLKTAELSDQGLGAPGSDDILSTRVLGAVRLNETLDSTGANLAVALAGGSFNINGASIAFDKTKDTLQDLLDRINGSTAGVKASYNNLTDQIVLTNNATGASSITRAEGTGGNFLASMGLLTGTDTIGKNATYTVGSDPTVYTSASNTIKDPAGKTGVTLTLKDTTTSAVTITVQSNHDGVTAKVKEFIEAFNSALDYIDEITLYDETTKKKAVLQFDPTVLGVKDKLLSVMNQQIFGLASGDARGSLSQLGITTGAVGTQGTAPRNRLDFEDSTKLWDALDDNPNRVAEMFGALTGSESRGIFSQVSSYLTDQVGNSGFSSVRQTSGKNRVSDIDKRIARLEQTMADRRTRYEKKFIAMEQAMLKSQTQQGQLNSFFLKSGLSSGG